MKKLITFMLILIITTSLIACNQEQNTPEEIKEALYDGIMHYDDHVVVVKPVSQHLRVYYFEVPYSEFQPTIQRYHKDDQLQQMVQAQLSPTELNNDTAITSYAWDLEPILESSGNIPIEHFPVAASTFNNDVVLIVYAPVYYVELRELFTRFRNDLTNHSENELPYDLYNVTEAEVFVFVSAEDGHIIHID